MEVSDATDDFPRDTVTNVVPDAQPKVCVQLSHGVYVAEQTDDERHEHWLICENLARQLVPVARKDA